MQELSLRPYNGRLFVVRTVKEYESAHKKLFKTPDVLTCEQEGRLSGGEGKDGIWTYLVFAKKHHILGHEISHVVLHVFERCGIDPISGNGEPFCYIAFSIATRSKELSLRLGGWPPVKTHSNECPAIERSRLF